MAIIHGKLYVSATTGESYPMRRSKYTVNPSPVHISDDMTAKMEGVPAISTSCKCNKFCIARMNGGNEICPHCFADNYLSCRPSVRNAMESNFRLLTSELLPENMIPIFKRSVEIVRIEAFGDVGNVTHARNYIRIMRANPGVQFGTWSKNIGIWRRAFDLEGGKPRNCYFVQSSEKMDVEPSPAYPWVDHVFTVFHGVADALRAGGKINCGARSCNRCRRCYNRRTGLYVRELLK